MLKSSESDDFDSSFPGHNGHILAMKAQIQKMNNFYNDARKSAFENSDGYIIGGGIAN